MPASRPEVAFCIVRRPFNALGVELERGEVVDIRTWRNPRPLIASHRLEPIPGDPSDISVTCDCGRSYAGDQAFADHRATHPSTPPKARTTRSTRAKAEVTS